jgi:hypothetical protein
MLRIVEVQTSRKGRTIADGGNSGAAFAVQELVRAKGKVFLISGAGASAQGLRSEYISTTSNVTGQSEIMPSCPGLSLNYPGTSHVLPYQSIPGEVSGSGPSAVVGPSATSPSGIANERKICLTKLLSHGFANQANAAA